MNLDLVHERLEQILQKVDSASNYEDWDLIGEASEDIVDLITDIEEALPL